MLNARLRGYRHQSPYRLSLTGFCIKTKPGAVPECCTVARQCPVSLWITPLLQSGDGAGSELKCVCAKVFGISVAAHQKSKGKLLLLPSGKCPYQPVFAWLRQSPPAAAKRCLRRSMRTAQARAMLSFCTLASSTASNKGTLLDVVSL